MAALGCNSPAGLAETMGWKRGTERLVAKWLAGQNNPGYEKTMEMLEKCGWLAVSDGSRDELGARRDRLAELETTVEAQGRATTMALKSLAAGIRKLERRLAAEDPPATKQARAR